MTHYTAPGIKDLKQLVRKKVDTGLYVATVAGWFNLFEDDIYSSSRKREIVVARQLLMCYFRQEKRMLLHEVADIFNKDHTTVIHAVATIKNLCETDRIFKDDKNQLFSLLNDNFNE